MTPWEIDWNLIADSRVRRPLESCHREPHANPPCGASRGGTIQAAAPAGLVSYSVEKMRGKSSPTSPEVTVIGNRSSFQIGVVYRHR